MKFLILLLPLIIGCETTDFGSQRDTSRYGFKDTDTGLRVTYEAGDRNIIPYAEFISIWNDTQACLGLSASEAPYIVIVNKIKGENYNGIYYVSDKVIEIEFTARNFKDVLAHEFIHYLAYENNSRDVIVHGSSYFEECAPNA